MAAKIGHPKLGGRKKGVPNKVTLELKEVARQYAPEAMAELARLAVKARTEQARVAAIREILDRGYGKAPQTIDANINIFDQLSLDEKRCLASALANLAAQQDGDAGGADPQYH